jgi:hypothetical protein
MSGQTIDERQSGHLDEAQQRRFWDAVGVGVYSILILLIMLAWMYVPA